MRTFVSTMAFGVLIATASVASARPDPGYAAAKKIVDAAGNRQTTPSERQMLLVRVQALAKKHPKSPTVAYAKGRVLSSLGRSKAALAAYDRALVLDPKFANAHYNAGVVLGRMGKSRAAAARFVAAGKIDPRHADAFYNAGQAYYDTGQFRKAMHQWRKVLKLEPGSFGVVKKILQCQMALGQWRAAASTRATLWNIHKTSRNPRIRGMKSVVVDQFKLRGYHVMVSESFATKGSFAVVYKFSLYRNRRAVAAIHVETSTALTQQGLDSIVVIVRPSGRNNTGLTYRKRPAYGKLRADMKRLIAKLK